VEKEMINYNFSPLLQGLSKINTITILQDEIIKQHIQNWLAIFHTGFVHQQKQFVYQPVRNMPAGTLGASVKKPPSIDRQIRKLKKQKEKIIALIERYCKKKLVFAHPLLPFGTVGEAHAHCTHLQIAQADPQT